MESLNIQAIFNSIDGEVNGFDGAGELATFIRLKGCNLKCINCDTAYSQNKNPPNYMTLDQIVNYSNIMDKITITGGEPLLQKETTSLINLLLELGHRITVETNGTIDFPKLTPITTTGFTFYTLAKNNLRYVIDYKLPSTKMNKFMNNEIFEQALSKDIIKFVIANEIDYESAKKIISENTWVARKVFSPGFLQDQTNISWPSKLADLMIKDYKFLQTYFVQFSLQIHKILWPNAKEEK